jgi:hypothetical protein
MSRSGDGKKSPPSVATNLVGMLFLTAQFAPMALLNSRGTLCDSFGSVNFYAQKANAALQLVVVLV